ncbi:TPA: hypothetical protein ACKF4R_001041 [Citrobacter amalonaticus]
MIDKYRLDDLRLESGEKGELARWVIQLQKDLDNERRKIVTTPSQMPMKDHQIRELVTELRDIAIDYHGTQQLRDRIARTVRAFMLAAAPQQEVEPVPKK